MKGDGRGGARPGSGPKKGISKWPSTIAKEQARELTRQFVMQHAEAMLRAQVEHAKGIQHFMLRNKDGQFERVTDPDTILKALNSGDENSYYIFTKDPSVQAFTDLMNRALDKPKEQAQEIDLTVTSKLDERLVAGRARVAALKKKKP